MMNHNAGSEFPSNAPTNNHTIAYLSTAAPGIAQYPQRPATPPAQVPTTQAFAAAPAQHGSAGQVPNPAGPAQLIARGLVKQYGPTHALNDLSLTVQAGESLAIMGPSGSGKTTLLHALAGIITPDHGSVELGQTALTPAGPVSALNTKQRTKLRSSTFGFVFQQGLLLPELTAAENIALAAMLAGHNRAEATKAAISWLVSLGIGEHAHKPVSQLSGGQAQRVAIARANITEPAVVFADEPTGALDQRTAAEVLHLLLASTTQRGRTLIMVTHDENVAATCSRTVRLVDGRIVADSARATSAPGMPANGAAVQNPGAQNPAAGAEVAR